MPPLARGDQDLLRRLTLGNAFSRVEFVDVTFTTANLDTEVRHVLRPKVADQVRYLVISASAATSVYHDTSAARRPWATDSLVLRASAPATVRLLLFLEPEMWA